ncbi:MliC family protein [Ahrensia kielensis]|uniref:MliC family protein n=1 Tax=Ahrensia kielensis TaxID=76980 RepID=UPI00035F47AB|nr:MliC family protein [Ahrensia kielensis]
MINQLPKIAYTAAMLGVLAGCESIDQEPSNARQFAQTTSVKIYKYTCNEGIPLTLRFEETGGNSFVTWTHDGFSGARLPQVRSGSGSRYAANGYEIHSKGNSVYLNLRGIVDNCRR